MGDSYWRMRGFEKVILVTLDLDSINKWKDIHQITLNKKWLDEGKESFGGHAQVSVESQLNVAYTVSS